MTVAAPCVAPVLPFPAAQYLKAVADHRDKEAMAQLFQYYAPRLKGWLCAGRLAEDVADDIVQETFFLVWQKAHLYQPGKAAASTWIYTLARNVRIDRLRQLHKIAALHGASVEIPDMEHEDVAENALSLRDALKKLPAEQVQILQDAFFLGLTHEEIARKRLLPLGTVKSRLRLALEKARNLLGFFLWILLLNNS
jgi:RNA polymerase sigma-70 factor, ECF subfamily